MGRANRYKNKKSMHVKNLDNQIVEIKNNIKWNREAELGVGNINLYLKIYKILMI